MIEVNQKNKQKKIVSLFSKNRNEKKQNRNKWINRNGKFTVATVFELFFIFCLLGLAQELSLFYIKKQKSER